MLVPLREPPPYVFLTLTVYTISRQIARAFGQKNVNNLKTKRYRIEKREAARPPFLCALHNIRLQS